MRPSARTTLLFAGALSLPFALFLWWTEADLRPRLEGEVRASLERQARVMRATIGEAAFTDSLADALGGASGSRTTLIDPTGRVVGDSDVEGRRLPEIENHAFRPEVAAALQGEPGFAIRASETVALRLLYVAVPDPRGVLRLSVPLSRIDRLVSRSRQWVLAGGLVTLVIVGVLGRRLMGVWTRPVQRLQETLAAVGSPETGRRASLAGGGTLASVGRSVDEAAARVEARIAELSRERSDLRSMFDALEDGVAQVDRAGLILRSNGAFEAWIGRPDLVGEQIGALLRDPENLAAVRRAIAGEPADNESTIGSHTVLLSATPHDRGALIVLRDLTRTRRLEAMRSDFVANVSHELKTPLTSIRGFAEAIEDAPADPEVARGFATRITANAGRMQVLVDDLLDLSRIESGAWKPEPIEIDLATVARETWEVLDPRPRAAGLSLDLTAADGEPVFADPDGLRQILRNLLDNAIRYAPAGSVVRVAAERQATCDRVTVEDTGPGIPSGQVERVFERFYRVDSARSREAGGTGLGLSIVKHVTVAHGGEVGIDSEVGRGTRVWFTLPVPPAREGAT